MNAPKSRSRLFLFLFTNITFLTAIAIAWEVVWFRYSYAERNWTWFNRSGSLIVIIGGLLACRHALRLTRDERQAFREMTVTQEFTRSEKEDQERDSRAALIGTILIVVGTIVWAYADLLPVPR